MSRSSSFMSRLQRCPHTASASIIGASSWPAGGQRAAARQAFLRRAALDEAGALELAQSPRQERGRDARHATMDLVELRAAVDEAADDEQRPALAQQLDCERERAVLTVLMCHGSLSMRPHAATTTEQQVVAQAATGLDCCRTRLLRKGAPHEDGSRARADPAAALHGSAAERSQAERGCDRRMERAAACGRRSGRRIPDAQGRAHRSDDASRDA